MLHFSNKTKTKFSQGIFFSKKWLNLCICIWFNDLWSFFFNHSSIYMFKRWNISSTLCDWKKSTITKVTTTSRILTQIPAWQRLYPIWESVAYVLTKKERKTVGCLFQKCIFVRVSDSPQSISRLFFVIRKWIAHGMVFSVFCMEFS